MAETRAKLADKSTRCLPAGPTLRDAGLDRTGQHAVARTGDFRMALAQRGGGAGCRLGVGWEVAGHRWTEAHR
ncbi:hypothetical protein PSEUDO9AG_70418 [Pseudomonas sp. 9Ag]|nr:hypothetical protein PSEUDO9AG_70418 [Pseudomonas sp. 9Ag]